ncbi:hypothetical protein QJQ45_026691 [Haematococcus lacustris]|nr:hypothetical protein QJQ45_026691 [Haematococcus lacustris]
MHEALGAALAGAAGGEEEEEEEELDYYAGTARRGGWIKRGRLSCEEQRHLHFTTLPQGLCALQLLGLHPPTTAMVRHYAAALSSLAASCPHLQVSPADLLLPLEVMASHAAMAQGSSDEEGDEGASAWLQQWEPRLHLHRLRFGSGSRVEAQALVQVLAGLRAAASLTPRVQARAEQLLLEQLDAFSDAQVVVDAGADRARADRLRGCMGWQVWRMVPLLKADAPMAGVHLGPGLQPPRSHPVAPNRLPVSRAEAAAQERQAEEEEAVKAAQWKAVAELLWVPVTTARRQTANVQCRTPSCE